MPEEIKNEIVNEAVEKTAEAIIANPKKIRVRKVATAVGLVTGAAALGYWIYKKVTKKDESDEDAAKAEAEVVDNVKIAERDCLDKDETEE